MRLAGRNSWTTGFDLIPGVPNLCPALIHPQDFMHDSPEGAAKMEAALVLFMWQARVPRRVCHGNVWWLAVILCDCMKSRHSGSIPFKGSFVQVVYLCD